MSRLAALERVLEAAKELLRVADHRWQDRPPAYRTECDALRAALAEVERAGEYRRAPPEYPAPGCSTSAWTDAPEPAAPPAEHGCPCICHDRAHGCGASQSDHGECCNGTGRAKP